MAYLSTFSQDGETPISDDSIRQEFFTEVESIIESNEAYGSNIQVLTYSVKNKAISGKFKDSWNNRVYEFIIDIDGISYKPAVKLDSANADDLPVRFDTFSEGYNSLFVGVRLDRNPIGKRAKKPKCGAEGYGCGFSCIGLAKTCRISNSEQKNNGNTQKEEIGKERLRKLVELGDKILGLGKKGALIRASDIKNQISTKRNEKAGQIVEGRKKELAQRQVELKKTQSIQAAANSQKIQPVEPKSIPVKSPKTSSKPQNKNNLRSTAATILSNSEFEVVDNKTARSKLAQWSGLYKDLEKQQRNVDNTSKFVSNIAYLERRKTVAENAINDIEVRKARDPASLERLTKLKTGIAEFDKEIALDQKRIKEAEDKYLKASKNTPLVDKKRLEAVTTILDALFEIKKDKDATLGGVTDKDGNLQAAYSYTTTPSGFKIDFLASAPWNCLPEHPSKKTGAGASAIEGMVKDILSKNKEGAVLELEALPDAVAFYEKIGFTINTDKKDGLPYMTLSKENARKFIEKQESKNKKDSESENAIAPAKPKELDELEEDVLGLFTVSTEIYNKIKK